MTDALDVFDLGDTHALEHVGTAGATLPWLCLRCGRWYRDPDEALLARCLPWRFPRGARP